MDQIALLGLVHLWVALAVSIKSNQPLPRHHPIHLD